MNVRAKWGEMKGVAGEGVSGVFMVEVSLALVGVTSPAMIQLYQNP